MSDAGFSLAFLDALRARDREGVNREAEAMLEAQLPLGPRWFDVATVLVSNAEVNLAIRAGEQGYHELGATPTAQIRLAEILASVGRQGDALRLATEIPTRPVNSLEFDQFVGTCALQVGQFDVARDAFERVVKAWPGAGAAWLSLSALPASDDSGLLEHLRAAGNAAKAARAIDRAQWHYALGAVLDRLDHPDEAFAQFAAGAAIVGKAQHYDSNADRSSADQVMATFTPNLLARADGERANRPIFVIGLPRSGTTLVEQILSAHEDVAGGDELPFGPILAAEAGDHWAQTLRSADGAQVADRLASLYLHFGDERFGTGRRRFVDKGLDNSRTIGLLAAILPAAPIVWIRRDPLNCAWSCFRTYFSNGRGVEWSWSLDRIAEHFKVEDQLFAFWKEALGDRLLVLDYEALASNSDEEIDRLYAHVGLVREANAPKPHEVDRPVSTASVTQVRQPIYQSSIDAAARYRKHLQPFIDKYRIG